MCTFNSVFSNLRYVIIGIVIAVVVLIIAISLVVYIVRKRRSAAEEASVDPLEQEESLQPLAGDAQ